MMGFDTVQDVTFTFDELNDEQMQQVFSIVARTYRHIRFWCNYEYKRHETTQTLHHFSVKHLTGSDLYTCQCQIRQQDLPLLSVDTDASYCQEAQCWNQIARANDAMLFDRHGEDLYTPHRYCLNHCSAMARHIRETVQVVNLTPDKEKYWTKVTSWEIRGRYYSQQLNEDQDGDYEVGYYNYCYASPWLGPFETRAIAIDTAQAWKS